MLIRAIAFLLALIPAVALGQVRQSGNVSPGHVACWTTSGIIQDGGTATAPFCNIMGVVGNGIGAPFFVDTNPTTGPFNQFTTSFNATAFQLDLTALGGATHIPLQFCVNGFCGITITDTAVSIAGSPATSLIIGTSAITGGTNTYCLYDNSGVLGNQPCGGSGGSLTIGTTAITGGTSTYCLTVVSGLLQNQSCGSGSIMTGTTNGIGRPDSVTTVVNGAGIFSVSDSVEAPRTSPITFVAADMGYLIPANSGASGITISATGFASTVFGPGMTSCVENSTAGAVTITNSSGASMFPAFTALQVGETICLTGDGTNMYAGVGKAPVSNVTSGGTGLSSVMSGVILRGAGANPMVASNLTDSGTLVSSATATVATPFALTDGATITPDGTHDNYTLTLTGDHTMLNPAVLTPGQNQTYQITQDGTGSRTLTWGGDFFWMSGAPPLLNSAASAVTFISCKVATASALYCAGGAPVPNYQAYSCAIPFTTGTGSGTLSCMMKVPRAFTVDNITATASGTFSTITPTFYECGTSTTCASSPGTIGAGAVTAANTATPITVSAATINSGDYIAVEITAATSTSGTITVLVEMH